MLVPNHMWDVYTNYADLVGCIYLNLSSGDWMELKRKRTLVGCPLQNQGYSIVSNHVKMVESTKRHHSSILCGDANSDKESTPKWLIDILRGFKQQHIWIMDDHRASGSLKKNSPGWKAEFCHHSCDIKSLYFIQIHSAWWFHYVSEKIWVRQFGFLFPIVIWNNKKCSEPPTSIQVLFISNDLNTLGPHQIPYAQHQAVMRTSRSACLGIRNTTFIIYPAMNTCSMASFLMRNGPCHAMVCTSENASRLPKSQHHTSHHILF